MGRHLVAAVVALVVYFGAIAISLGGSSNSRETAGWILILAFMNSIPTLVGIVVVCLLSMWLRWRVFIVLGVAAVMPFLAGRQFGILFMPVVTAAAYQAVVLFMEDRRAS